MTEFRRRIDNRHSGIRVRDTDRVDACALLDAARDEGELTAAEHAQRTAAAMRASTFGDLDKLLGDLQIPRNLADAPVVRPDRRAPSRRWQAAAAVVLVAALLGALGGCVGRVADPGVALPDPTTGPGLAAFIEAYRAHFGDTMVDEVSLYPGYVLVERAAGTQSERLRYDRKGFGSYSTSSRASDVVPIDLATLDVPALARLLAGAPETVGAPGAGLSHVIIEHEQGEDAVVRIYADTSANGGFLEVSTTGEPLAVHPVQR
ncbi:DUF1707 SHOCT-like domain-containing protein [Nocardia huaxiensis]|uniref:DUF1707 domain-containing protein n=1 Tax=Nocardia huaxiensis TaxID=2755382 RepID=A0A7D6ZX81_9NOCA|nr:DUF1707 domain-containing protein [Nocardia huaxiensis]QLY30809.1 DUF1707 domain-containing protein [Nocardia huaxiensis]UFS94302.1 DUF1707 domain-containing protein [Nocardia huaxiensis]